MSGRIEYGGFHGWPLFTDHFFFAKNEVSLLRPYCGFFSGGVQIEHMRGDYPPFVVFWSFEAARLLADASAAGFLISN